MAALVLDNLSCVQLYHHIHGLRHPLGLYNVTFGEVVSKAKRVLDELDSTFKSLPELEANTTDWNSRLADATDHFLDAIIQHLDTFYNILLCFYGDLDSKETKKRNRSIIKAIRTYRDQVAKIVNYIKHRQCRLSSMYFYDQETFIPGYFVEGTLYDGTIGPHPELHKGANVAISYHRDMPFHLCNLYYASAALASEIHAIVGATAAKNLEHGTSDDDLESIIKRIAVLPSIYYPDEVRKAVPFVKYSPAKPGKPAKVLLECPSRRLKPRTVTRGCRARVSWKGDGVSRTFKMPYFGKDAPNKPLESDA